MSLPRIVRQPKIDASPRRLYDVCAGRPGIEVDVLCHGEAPVASPRIYFATCDPRRALKRPGYLRGC